MVETEIKQKGQNQEDEQVEMTAAFIFNFILTTLGKTLLVIIFLISIIITGMHFEESITQCKLVTLTGTVDFYMSDSNKYFPTEYRFFNMIKIQNMTEVEARDLNCHYNFSKRQGTKENISPKQKDVYPKNEYIIPNGLINIGQ